MCALVQVLVLLCLQIKTQIAADSSNKKVSTTQSTLIMLIGLHAETFDRQSDEIMIRFLNPNVQL